MLVRRFRVGMRAVARRLPYATCRIFIITVLQSFRTSEFQNRNTLYPLRARLSLRILSLSRFTLWWFPSTSIINLVPDSSTKSGIYPRITCWGLKSKSLRFFKQDHNSNSAGVILFRNLEAYFCLLFSEYFLRFTTGLSNVSN